MVTTRDLSRSLGVPMAAVVKATMSLGWMKTAREPLTDHEVELVTALLRSPPTGPDEGSGGAGVREPRKPGPRKPSTKAQWFQRRASSTRF